MITEIYNYLLEQVLHNQFAQGGIIIGLLSSSFYYLRFIPLGIYNMIKRKIVYTAHIGRESLYYDYFNTWFFDNYKQNFRNVKVLGDENEPYLEQYVDNFIFWYNSYPIKITKTVEKLEGANNIFNTEVGKFELSTIFNKNIIDDLVNEVAQHAISKRVAKRSSHAYIWSNSERWNYFKTFGNVGLDSLVIEDELKGNIVKTFNNWIQDKEILEKKGKQLGLTYFLYGPPGCGKSSMAAALAIQNKLDVYYLNLNSITSLDMLNSAILAIGRNAILLIEEIEDVYDGREMKDPNCKVPISGLLNILSGVSHRSDLIIIFTSNSIDKLDPALLRPGRIDLFVKFTEPTEELVQKYINKFYNKSDKIEIKTMPESMAELENWCIANLHNYDKLINKLQND